MPLLDLLPSGRRAVLAVTAVVLLVVGLVVVITTKPDEGTSGLTEMRVAHQQAGGEPAGAIAPPPAGSPSGMSVDGTEQADAKLEEARKLAEEQEAAAAKAAEAKAAEDRAAAERAAAKAAEDRAAAEAAAKKAAEDKAVAAKAAADKAAAARAARQRHVIRGSITVQDLKGVLPPLVGGYPGQDFSDLSGAQLAKLEKILDAIGEGKTYPCPRGPGGGFDDMYAGAQVVVADGNGSTIATSELTGGIINRYGCTFGFSIRVPDRPFYAVTVTHRGAVTYSRQDLARSNWRISTSL